MFGLTVEQESSRLAATGSDPPFLLCNHTALMHVIGAGQIGRLRGRRRSDVGLAKPTSIPPYAVVEKWSPKRRSPSGRAG